jgi:MFS family permease
MWTRRSSSLPRAFWWLWAGALVNALCTFVFPFLALFLTARGFSVSLAGLMAAAFGAGSVLSGPVSGFAADRFGRRPVLLLSLGLSAAFTALLGTLSSHWAIGSVVLALGLAWSGYRPAASAVIADVVPPAGRARAFGWIYWAHNLGFAISLAGGGTLVAWGYRTLFLADAATTFLFLLVVAWRIPETRAPLTVQARTEPGGFGPVLSDFHFVLFLAVNVIFILPFFQFQVSLPVDMAQHGLGPQGFGFALAVNGVVIALLQPVAGRVLPRFEPARALCIACVLVAAGYGAYALCRNVPEYALATGVWTLGEILYFPVVSALVASLAPPGLQGRYQGLFSMSFGIGMTLAPLTGPILMEHFGAPVLWRSCFGVGLLVAFAELVIGRLRAKQMVKDSR